MKPIVFAFITLFFSIEVFAQTITGKVIDDQNQPIEFANITLYSLPDSIIITGTITNKQGGFSLDLSGLKESYLKVSFIGYEMQIVPAITEQTIVLKGNNHLLGEFTVQGERKTFQMQNGNMVANVSGTILAKEVSAVEVLRKIPGMTLKDGQLVSFIGGAPVIYINGKKVQSIAEVQQLEVKNIKSVELNTNPGAEYDASVGAVLLITTYKRLEGLAVQVENTIRRNHLWSHENSVKINYNHKKVNFFGQVGYSDWRRKTTQDLTTKVYTPDTTWMSRTLLCDSHNSYATLSYSLGVDYSLSDKHSIGFKYDGENEKYDMINSQPLTLWANDVLVSELKSQSIKNDKGSKHYFNAYYRGNITKKFQMELFSDYLIKYSDDNQLVSESSIEYGSHKTNISTGSDNSLFAINPKFYYTLNSKHQFSAGTEYSFSDVQTMLKYTPDIFDNTRSANSENRWTGYLSYNFKNKGFGLNLGLRYEWVNYHYDDLNHYENNVHRTYSDWFPNVQFSYQKGNWAHSLRYRSGILRPSYNSLNGNTFYVNQFMYQEGNPKLVPEISHNLQYNLMYRFVYVSLRYSYFKNIINNDFQTLGPTSNVIKSTYINYDKAELIQALVNLRHTFNFYTPSLTLALMENFMTVPVNGELIQINKPFGYINFNNDFEFKKGFLLNVEYIYTGPGTTGFFYFKPTHLFNIRVQKMFLKDKLQISLTVNDIFNKQIGRYIGQINHIYMDNVDDQDRRSVVLNMIWRFNNYKKTYKGQSASEDEINRL